MRPWRLQPVRASQVIGLQVGGGLEDAGGCERKPSNQAAEEQGLKGRESAGRCFLKFIST